MVPGKHHHHRGHFEDLNLPEDLHFRVQREALALCLLPSARTDKLLDLPHKRKVLSEGGANSRLGGVVTSLEEASAP